MSEHPYQRHLEPNEPNVVPDQNFTLTRDLLASLPEPETAADTARFTPDEAPELVIRAGRENVVLAGIEDTEDGRKQLDKIRADYRIAYGDMETFGIEVLPFQILQRDSELVIATRKVHGTTALEAVTADPDKLNLLCDSVLAGQVEYLEAARRNDTLVAPDAIGLEQFMYGRYAGDSGENRLLLVDLDPSPKSIANGSSLEDPHEIYSLLQRVGENVLRLQSIQNRENILPKASECFLQGMESLLTNPRVDKSLVVLIHESIKEFIDNDFETFRIAPH